MPNNNQNIEIRSEEVQEILAKVPNWMIRWGNTLLFLLIITILFITWFVKYPDVITAQVVITTVNPPEKLYANVDGKFEAIFVLEGDSIVSNQTLAVIENTALSPDVFLLKRVVDTMSISRDNFQFPIDNLPPLILGDISSAFANFENDYLEYELNKKLKPYENESHANQLSVIESKSRLKILLIQEELGMQELAFKEKDLERQKILFDQHVISAIDYEQKQIEFLQVKKAFQGLKSSISQIKEAISSSQKNRKGGTIENTQKESRLLKRTIQSFYQLKNAIHDWNKRYALKSSINGLVSFHSIWDKSQVVKNGDLVFTVIPTENRNIVGKIKAPVANSGKVRKGQMVQISVANYPSYEFGELSGKISSISLVPNQEGNYQIDVELPQRLITSYNREIAFRQEMEGSASIITEDLRLIERFFYQLKNIVL